MNNNPTLAGLQCGCQNETNNLTMTENFAQLFEESLKEIETRPGAIVKGTIVSIDKDIVLVDAGFNI